MYTHVRSLTNVAHLSVFWGGSDRQVDCARLRRRIAQTEETCCWLYECREHGSGYAGICPAKTANRISVTLTRRRLSGVRTHTTKGPTLQVSRTHAFAIKEREESETRDDRQQTLGICTENVYNRHECVAARERNGSGASMAGVHYSMADGACTN